MNRTVRGILLGCLGASCWGFSGVFINYLVSHYDLGVAWIGSVRLLVAGAGFLAFVLATDRKNLLALLHDARSLGLVALFSLVGMGLYQVVYIVAIREAGAAPESVISQTGQIYVMLYTCRAEHRRPRRLEVLAIALAISGVFCIATNGDLSQMAISAIGLLWCLIDGVFLCLHNIIPLKPLHRYGSMPVNAVGLFLGGLMIAPFGQPWCTAVEMGADGWLALAGTVVVGAALGYLFAMQALLDAGTVKGTLALAVEPVAAMVASICILGDTFTLWDVAGCLLIIAMIVLLTLPAKPSAPPRDR